MTLQWVFSILTCSPLPLGLAELQACPFPDVVFPPLPLSALSSSPFHCALQDGFGQTWWTGNMTIPLQFASFYGNWLMMLHHHTKCGNKMFCGSEDIRTNIQGHFEPLLVTLSLNALIQFFHRILKLKMPCYQTKFGCKQTSSLKDIVEIVTFWLYKPLLWPWHWR